MPTVKTWVCDECGRKMTEKEAARSMRKGCPAGCGGIDIHEIVPVIDLMQALKDSLAATKGN